MSVKGRIRKVIGILLLLGATAGVLFGQQIRNSPERGGEPAIAAMTPITLPAIDRLLQIGTPAAFDGIFQAMTSPTTEQWLKRLTLTRLGKLGTPDALAVVERFTEWAQRRPDITKSFRFGDRKFPVAPEVQATGNDGTKWAMFSLGMSGGNIKRPTRESHWFVTRSKDGVTWEQPIYTGALPQPKKWLQAIATAGAVERSLTKDSDGDGLTDKLEQFLGTDLNKKDSDGDGEADAADPFPLTPRQQAIDDVHAICQAVFTLEYGSAPLGILAIGSEILTSDKPQPAQVREFDGFAGWVMPATETIPAGNRFALAILEQTPTSALVQVDFWAIGERYKLEKKEGHWVVVEVVKAWVT
jgi:hypothetical protein